MTPTNRVAKYLDAPRPGGPAAKDPKKRRKSKALLRAAYAAVWLLLWLLYWSCFVCFGLTYARLAGGGSVETSYPPGGLLLAAGPAAAAAEVFTARLADIFAGGLCGYPSWRQMMSREWD